MKKLVIACVLLAFTSCMKDGKPVVVKDSVSNYKVEKGFEVVPVDNMPYEYCMGKDIEELLKCDGIICCHDWFGSKGCRAECSVAQVYGKQIKIDNTPYDENKI